MSYQLSSLVLKLLLLVLSSFLLLILHQVGLEIGFMPGPVYVSDSVGLLQLVQLELHTDHSTAFIGYMFSTLYLIIINNISTSCLISL
jgi:hypothetical protein